MRKIQWLCSRWIALLTGCVMLAASVPSGLLAQTASAEEENDANFAKALQYSIYFYDANMCGTEVSEQSRFSWRGDCHTYDAQVPLQPMDSSSVGTNLSQTFIDTYRDVLDPDGDGYIDVSGGFHDAGDHVKFGMPEDYAASTLGWGYYEFRESYEKTGQADHMETVLRYFNDYLMKCTFLDEDGMVIAHCYQVGDGDIDHKYWNSPEIDSMARPAYFLTAEKPQTDYVAAAAASLAVNYLNFKDTDPDYAAKSLQYAKALFSFAQTNEKQLSDNADGPKQYYKSSKWEDDYCWAAAWLYKITGDHAYLEEIYPYYDYYAAPSYVYCWNDVWGGVQCLLGEISEEKPLNDGEYTDPNFISEYKEYAGKQYEDLDCWQSIQKALTNYQTGGIGTITPGGYFWLDTWGSARYNTAAQFIALVYDKYNNDGQPGTNSEWAKGQMEYLLGDNPLGRAYVVGYNENAAKYPHHRASSGLTRCEDTREQRHVLYGALVGGPDQNDNHNDVTADYTYNEVTIDYNAAFVGACAGLYAMYGNDTMEVTPDFPPQEAAQEGGTAYWVEAFAVDNPCSGGAGTTKLSLKVMTDSIEPRTDITVRYYFSTEEMTNPSLVAGSELYDQAAMEASPADGVISGPYQYDASFDPNIYYVEISWDGYTIANSNKKYQCSVGLYYGDTWDPSNDWSYQDLSVLTDSELYQDGNEVKSEYICVYAGGELVGGTEPDGSQPAASDPGSTTTTTVTTTTTSSVTTTTATGITTQQSGQTSSSVSSALEGQLVGDVNLDGQISLSDLVIFQKYIGLRVAFNAQQERNADCNSDDQIDDQDVRTLLRFLIGSLKAL